MQSRTARLAFLAASALPAASFGANLDGYYMDSNAALQAGAISADATGGGAVWYNPAGLATISGLRLDASATALRLSLGGVPSLDATGTNRPMPTPTSPKR